MSDTIDTNDFERAKGALADALSVAGPILGALQNASLVFDVMQNATVYRTALERDVADLQAQAETAKRRRTEWDELSTLSMQRAADAEAEANSRVAGATESAETVIADLHAALSAQIAAAQAEATDTLQGIAKAATDARAEHDTEMAAMANDSAAMQEQIDTLAKKLDALKTNAAKFAAALQG
jgi:hypothetical protein